MLLWCTKYYIKSSPLEQPMFYYYCFVREVLCMPLYYLLTLCSSGLKQQVTRCSGGDL